MLFIKAITSRLSVRSIPYLLVVPILLFQALSLAGCLSTSPALPDLYIVSFTKNTTSFPEIRLGYFGMCSLENNTVTHCLSTARSSAETVLPALFPNLTTTTSEPRSVLTPSSKDLSALLSGALLLQSQVFIPILAGAALVFLAALLLLGLLKRAVTNPNPDRPRRADTLQLGATACLCLSTALGFTASLSTSEAAGALQYSSLLLSSGGSGAGGQMVIRPGMALQVLQWLTCGFTLLFTMSVPWLLRGGRGGWEDKV